jgi:hypothetical protein
MTDLTKISPDPKGEQLRQKISGVDATQRTEVACFIEGATWCCRTLMLGAKIAELDAPNGAKHMTAIASELLEAAKKAAAELYPEHAPLSAPTKRPNLGY